MVAARMAGTYVQFGVITESSSSPYTMTHEHTSKSEDKSIKRLLLLAHSSPLLPLEFHTVLHRAPRIHHLTQAGLQQIINEINLVNATIMGFVSPSVNRVPNEGEPLHWLLVLANFAPHIPMYQITRILQLKFRRPYDPVRTRELYELMEKRLDWILCEIIEEGIDNRRTQNVLQQAAGLRESIIESEHPQPLTRRGYKPSDI